MATDQLDVLLKNQGRAAVPMLHLFGGPYVTIDGSRKDIPEGSKRLLVFVALNRRRVERRYAAGTLWPVGDDARASGNLRSALWRLHTAGISLLAVDKWSLKLRDDVLVDVHVVTDWANRLLRSTNTCEDLSVLPWWADALDLLPGWYDDWVLMERERIRQRILHGLEALSRHLVRADRYAEAVEVAMMAVAVEPLRETAQWVLIEAHMAEGNWIEVRRSFEAYRVLLRSELGVEPSAEMESVVLNYGDRGAATVRRDVAGHRNCRCRERRPCSSGGVSVLVEDAAESIV